MFKPDISKTVCFTGHRSQKLPWRFNEQDERCRAMKEQLRFEIVKAIQSGYKTFLCGMAIGFDMICAETVIDLKKQYKDVRIIGALPCRTQDIKWPVKDRERYKNLLSQLDDIRCIYDEYIGAECMHIISLKERNMILCIQKVGDPRIHTLAQANIRNPRSE